MHVCSLLLTRAPLFLHVCVQRSWECSKCAGGGKGLIALQVFGFIGLTAVLFMSLLRVFGKSVAALEPTRKSLLIEFALTALNAFWSVEERRQGEREREQREELSEVQLLRIALEICCSLSCVFPFPVAIGSS